ncbi:MAG: hypothetical protein M0R74_12310 [Dehalococcoidia bacterium]|nr:hypothetical protein [Dehalococcoidia bacterium]
MSQIIAFPAPGTRWAPAPRPSPASPPGVQLDPDALSRLARDLDALDPDARQPLAALLAAIDETGELRALRRARAAAAFQRTARPAVSAEARLRNPLSSSWLPILSAVS